MPLASLLIIPLAGALLPALFGRLGRDGAAWAGAGVTGAGLALLLMLAPDVFAGDVVQESWPWIPLLGLDISLRLDGLGLVFALLVLGIGLLVVLYARYYLPESDCLIRFYTLLLLFQAAMLGIVLSDNLLLLLVFWELTSITSFLLIAYHHDSPASRQGARMALAITGAGGLAMLAGFLLIGEMVGSYELGVVLASGDTIRDHALYVPALLLVLLGAFTKSAQFPFHVWLPNAMAAPTPISAYLHSATMVKAGVFLLARLFPVLANTEIWFYVVGGAGLTTLLFGAYVALFKHDLKGLLAYSTISHLGLITLLFGLGTPLGAVAGIFHVINHAIFKASLFMAAGIIDHECGTRDMRRINGLMKYMPYTAVLAMVAAGSMAGVPLLNGFLSKEMFFAETVHQQWLGPLNWLLPAMATLAGVFAVAYSARFVHDVFFNGEPVDLDRTPREPPRWMRIPVDVLVALVLLVGIFPNFTIRPLLDTAASSVLGTIPHYSLAIWHGFTLPLLMSLLALGGGIAVYAVRYRLFAAHDRLFPRTDGKQAFQRGAGQTVRLSRRLMYLLDNCSLQRYGGFLIATALLLGAIPTVGMLEIVGGRPLTAVDGVSLAATLVLLAGALGTVVWRRQRMVALVMISIVGLVVWLTFVHFSAPDLALTQVSVEVVTTVLLLLALYFIPGGDPLEVSAVRRLRDITLALLAGVGTGLLALAMMTRPLQPISDYYLSNAKALGGGSNVVNVILVDFRGFDTLGEITVLAIAAAGIYAMLKGLRLELPQRDQQGRPWAHDVHPLILATISRPLLPLALLVSLFLLLRGHNQPGGGFIAGLVAGTALILQHLASGIGWTAKRLNFRYLPLLGVGTGLAALTGLAAVAFGRPFLTSAVLHLELPLFGELELASAMAFDVGVFLAVVGTVLLILESLGRLSRDQVTHPAETAEERS